MTNDHADRERAAAGSSEPLDSPDALADAPTEPLLDGPVDGDDLSAAAVAERTARTEAAGRRPCEHCGRPIPRGARRDARFCSTKHRNDNGRQVRRQETAELGPA